MFTLVFAQFGVFNGDNLVGLIVEHFRRMIRGTCVDFLMLRTVDENDSSSFLNVPR